MNRLIARLIRLAPAASVLASTLAMAEPLAAQQTYSLPPASPAPTPAPAGPADERAGVAIPPRAVATARPTATATTASTPAPSPTVTPRPVPRASVPPPRTSAPSATTAPPAATPVPGPAAALPETQAPGGPSPSASVAAPPLASAPSDAGGAAGEPLGAAAQLALPDWWPFAAGGLGALVLLGAGVLLWRSRKAKPLRLAAPVAGSPAAAPAAQEPPRLDLTLEITSASRSLMMFTLEYRLTIANRSERAVGDLHTAAELACARASAATDGRAAPSAGAAQALAAVDRIGPHQARSVTGTLRLPLTAIAPLRQGQTPLFVPLVHVTLEGESLAAQARTFVIGTPSPSGRIHPIKLDTPPGGIAGLVAQAVAAQPASAAA